MKPVAQPIENGFSDFRVINGAVNPDQGDPHWRGPDSFRRN